MGYFLKPWVVAVLGPGRVEGASVNVLGVRGQMAAHRKRQILVCGIRQGILLFEWLELDRRLPADLRVGLKGKDVGDDLFAFVRR